MQARTKNSVVSLGKPAEVKSFHLDSATKTNNFLVESVFGISLQPPANDLLSGEHRTKKAHSLIVQPRYFFNDITGKPLALDIASKKFKDFAEKNIKTFKYLYMLNLTAAQFGMICHAFLPSKKLPELLYMQDPVTNKSREIFMGVNDAHTTIHPIVEAVIIDNMELNAVLALLRVLPSNVKKIGLTQVPQATVDRVTAVIAHSGKIIEVSYSDLIPDVKQTVVPTANSPRKDTSPATSLFSREVITSTAQVSEVMLPTKEKLKRSESVGFEEIEKPVVKRAKSDTRSPLTLPQSDLYASFSPGFFSSAPSLGQLPELNLDFDANEFNFPTYTI